eukprot:g6498.t1
MAQPPKLSSQFLLRSIEIDDTSGGIIVLNQTLAMDPVAKRSLMIADGALVDGHLEQIVRCDLSTGYFLNIQKESGAKTLSCQNMTRNCDQAWQPFWVFPSNISYEGKSALPKRGSRKQYNKYFYWDNYEKYTLYLDEKNQYPVWYGKVFTTHPGYHLWHFEYSKYISGAPPESVFGAPKDLKCSHPSSSSSDSIDADMKNSLHFISGNNWYLQKTMMHNSKIQQHMVDKNTAISFSTSPVQMPPHTKEIAPNVFMPYINLGHPDTPLRNETAALELWLSSAVNGSGIDTAFDYMNQQEVGNAIRESGRDRASLFVTTKIPNVFSREKTLEYIKKDLNQLGLEYVDLILIHSPCYTGFPSENCTHASVNDIQDAWNGMMDAYNAKLTRSIGVSNFISKDIEPILQMKGAIAPSVNQCEMYISEHDDDTREFCQKSGITYEAYSPLGRGKINFQDPTLQKIAKAHNVSVFQVCLRWIIQQQCTIAVSSTKLSHDLSDLDVFNFELTESEMETLSSM